MLLALGGIITLAVLGTNQGQVPLLKGSSRAAYQVAMLALSLGSLPICAIFYRMGLIPQWPAALGLVGYVSLLADSVLELYGLDLRLLHTCWAASSSFFSHSSSLGEASVAQRLRLSTAGAHRMSEVSVGA